MEKDSKCFQIKGKNFPRLKTMYLKNKFYLQVMSFGLNFVGCGKSRRLFDDSKSNANKFSCFWRQNCPQQITKHTHKHNEKEKQ